MLMSIFCVRDGCELQLVSYMYDFKHVLQCRSDKPFVRTYMRNFKTTGHIWRFGISNDCSTIGDIPCEAQSCMRDPNGELRPQTCIGRSGYNIVCEYCKPVHTSLFGAKLCMTTKFTYLRTAYYTPNNGFTATNASLNKNKVGYLHYMLQCLFD